VNPRIAEIPPSLIRTISAMKRPGDIDLGLGEPTLPPDLDAFTAALEWTRGHGSPYSPNAGFPELREAIAGYLSGVGLELDGANVCVTVGSEEALYLAIKTVVDPAKDEVLIVEPCYLAYPKICLLEGIATRMVALNASDRFQPRAEVVLEALSERTRLVVINTPSNPTGRIWPEAELQRLSDGLRKRSGEPVYVLADEVYRELFFTGEPPATIATFHPHTLVAGSLSKSNALTGLRLGWLAGPAEVIAAATKVHQFVNTSASTFSQRVAMYLFEDDARIAAHRSAYTATRERLVRAAEEHAVEIIPPEGAFYAFLRLPRRVGNDSLAAAQDLMERQRVLAVPGRAFGESGEGWLRISWVAPPEVVEEGIRRIAQWGHSSV
jgi:aspartate/methionine/tyrosine aminotransferase